MWLIVCMGGISSLFLVVALMLSLGQFQETPAADWVKLAELIQHNFHLDHVSVRVTRRSPPKMEIAYLTRTNSKFDLTEQNAEMDRVAHFALENYKGRDLTWIEQADITRSETHGSGCFQQTYVAHFSLPNPKRSLRSPDRTGYPPAPPFPGR